MVFNTPAVRKARAGDRGLNDIMSMRLPRATVVEAAKRRLYRLVEEVVARAQQAGRLRADVTPEDLVFLHWANARILQATRAAGAPDAWRRHLGLLLDGFRADRAHRLPEPPLSPRQVYRAMLTLGASCIRGRRVPSGSATEPVQAAS